MDSFGGKQNVHILDFFMEAAHSESAAVPRSESELCGQRCSSGNQLHILEIVTRADNSELAAVPGSESELLIEQSSSSVWGFLANGGLLIESGSESELWEQSSSSFGGLLAHEGLLSENATTEDEFVDFACEGPSSENPKPDILLGDLNAEGYIGVNLGSEETYNFQLRDFEATYGKIASSSSPSSSLASLFSDKERTEVEASPSNLVDYLFHHEGKSETPLGKFNTESPSTSSSTSPTSSSSTYSPKSSPTSSSSTSSSSSSTSSSSTSSSTSSSSLSSCDEDNCQGEDFDFHEKAIRNVLARTPSKSEREATPPNLVNSLLPHEGWCLRSLLWRESEDPAGGLFAYQDFNKEQCIASLILHHKHFCNTTYPWEEFFSSGTLIVCSKESWEMRDMIKKCWQTGSLKLLCFDGPRREEFDLLYYDVVITTYKIVRLEAARSRQSKLFQTKFSRIILDDAFVIMDPVTQISEDVCMLRGDRRWAVTATPVPDSCLFSYLRFLKATPFNDVAIWNYWVDEPAGDKLRKALHESLQIRRGPILSDF